MPLSAAARRNLAPLAVVTAAAVIFALLLLLVRLQWAPLESADHYAAARLNNLVAGHPAAIGIILVLGDETAFLERPDHPRQAWRQNGRLVGQLRCVELACLGEHTDNPPLLFGDVMLCQDRPEVTHDRLAGTQEPDCQGAAAIVRRSFGLYCPGIEFRWLLGVAICFIVHVSHVR